MVNLGFQGFASTPMTSTPLTANAPAQLAPTAYLEPFYIILSPAKRQQHMVRNRLIAKRSQASPLTVYLAVTLHNLTFQAQVMGGARDAIMNSTFPSYLKTFFADYFGQDGYPEWCGNALRSVGVDLLEHNPDAKVVPGAGGRWEYADAS